jgi:Ca2+-binding EF-hand superfamily protein
MKKLLVAGAVICISWVGTAQAQKETPSDVYPSFSDIPLPLSQGLMGSQYPEKYVSQILEVIRQTARDNSNLTADDIKTIKEKADNDRRRRQVQEIIAYDSNFDGNITRDEIVGVLSSSPGRGNEQFIGNQASRIMDADIDKDGVITTEEMSTIRDKKDRYSSYRYRDDPSSFLELDPDGDGKLTIAELTGLAEKAFRTVDVNADGILSRKEMDAIQGTSRQYRDLADRLSPSCTLPKAQAGEKIVFIGVYEGKAVSTMSVAGQEEETNAIPLQIDEGNEKLYIVTSAVTPVIWQLKGNTSRVARIVLAGGSTQKDTSKNAVGEERINVGVTGVPKDKVTFSRAQDCGMVFGYEQEGTKKKLTLDILTRLLGRSPDLYFAQHGVTGLHVFGDRINTDISTAIEESQKQAPPGFERNSWSKHIRFMPGGLIDLKGQEIISDAKAVPYEVLPKWAGIAKLVYDGAIVPDGSSSSAVIVTRPGQDSLTIEGIENIRLHEAATTRVEFDMGRKLKIVKDIPYYPSGLHGGYSAYFIIGKGVTPPKGSAGHSDVILEETGEQISGPGMHR